MRYHKARKRLRSHQSQSPGIEPLELRRLLSTTWYVDAAASGPAHDGASWGSAYTDLQQALGAAVAGDAIHVAQGEYKPTSTTDRTISFQLKTGVEIDGGYAGSISPTPDARDVSAYPTILSGDIGSAGDNTDNSYHVVVAIGADPAVVNGITITGGHANGGGNSGDGGGILNLSEGVTMIDCTFAGNSASGGGGMLNASSSPTLINCTFYANSANNGGAIYNNSSLPILMGCIFDANSADYGGAISNDVDSSPVLTNCIFIKNSANIYGGGLYNFDFSSPNLKYCMFEGNVSDVSGGGIYADEYSSPTLTDCAMTGSIAGDYGGAIYDRGSSSPVLNNCTLTANSASASGGAIYNDNVTSAPTLTNSILWGNAAPSVPQISAGATTISDSDIQGGFAGTGNIDADPLFYRNPSAGADGTWGIADDDYGDMRLLPGSSCIDSGSNTAVPAGVTTDVTGNPRIVDFPGVNDPGAIVDMGAYEANTNLGTMHLTSGQHVVLPAGGHGFSLSKLTIDPGATLDLKDDGLVIPGAGLGGWTGAGYDGLTGMIQSGAIFSSLAENHYTTVGIAFELNGVHIRFTYVGDANLDGKVNIDDYGRIDGNVAQSGQVFGWFNGDFNLDGKINIDDYGLIDGVIGVQGPVL